MSEVGGDPYRRRRREPTGASVVVGDYSSPIDAELDRTALEVAGVACTLDGFGPIELSGATGRSVLRVDQADEDEAKAVLERVRAASREHDRDGPDQQHELHRCPRCELPYTSFGRWRPAGGSALAALYLLPLTLASRPRLRCQTCGYAWDDPAECPSVPTQLLPGDPKPVFRLRRAEELTGAFVGIIFGVVLLIALRAEGLTRWFALATPIALGFVLGRSFSKDLCSLPSCRAVLPPGAEACSSCHGTIAGRVSSSAEHWALAAEVRRELAAARGDVAPRKKKRKKAAA